MARVEQVKGLNAIIRAFQGMQRRHAGGVSRGLKVAGAYLLRCSMEIVPVDMGPLRASGFVRHSGHGFDTQVRVGYTEWYAAYVHEVAEWAHGEEFNRKYADAIASGRIKPKRPNEQYKFLEKPARNEHDVMAGIVRREAQRSLQ